jgi:hypothetical protein
MLVTNEADHAFDGEQYRPENQDEKKQLQPGGIH